jgi:hypothetical protein
MDPLTARGKVAPSRSRLRNALNVQSRAREQAVILDSHHGLLSASDGAYPKEPDYYHQSLFR